MFAGITETKAFAIDTQKSSKGIHLKLERPTFFKDIKKGDSISVDGVCLTVESFSDKHLTFFLVKETLKICSWFSRNWTNHAFNLERSLLIGKRIHGHYVTGHVDALVQFVKKNKKSSEWVFQFPHEIKPYLWLKGSITLNGVSLTINKVGRKNFTTSLIPETLRRTNLFDLNVGDKVHVEADFIAKAVYHQLASQRLYVAKKEKSRKEEQEDKTTC